MKLSDMISMATDGIKERKFRVGLNVLGILIGISAIVALLSITEGMRIAINQQMELLDPKTIIVIPGSFMGMPGQRVQGASVTGATLTLRDIDRVKRIPGVVIATPVISKTVEVQISGHSDFVTIRGIIPEEYTQVIQNIEVVEGRFLRRNDGMSTVLGARVAHPQHLEEPIARLGSRVTLYVSGEEGEERATFRVAGILDEVGGTMLGSPDYELFTTIRMAQRILHTGNTINEILIETESIESVSEIADEIQNVLGEDVMVISSQFIVEMIGTVTATIEAILGGIAAISLIVAGIAVINTMTISVMERTREIGVMKALGAKNKDVLMIFLTESFLTGLIGGVLGVAFGVFLGQIVSTILTFSWGISLTAVPSVEVGIVGIIFAVTTGTLSGLYPARKASKLDPVEALRYE